MKYFFLVISICMLCIFSVSASAQQDSGQKKLTEYGVDDRAFVETIERINGIRNTIESRDDKRPTEAELAALRDLRKKLEGDFSALLPKVDRELDETIPSALRENGLSPEFIARCRGFTAAIDSIDDEASRAEVIEENTFCSGEVARVLNEIRELKAAKKAAKKVIDDEIAKLEARRNELTQEELDRLNKLRAEAEDIQEEIDELSDGEQFLLLLQLVLSFADFVAGVAALVSGNPAGLAMVGTGIAGMKDAVDKLNQSGGTDLQVTGPLSDGSTEGVRDALDGPDVNRDVDSIKADGKHDGDVIPTSTSGPLYATSEALGTENARLRFYRRSDDKLLLELTPDAVTNDPEKGLENITKIVRFDAAEGVPEGQVILILVSELAGETVRFALKLRPLSNGTALLIPAD